MSSAKRAKDFVRDATTIPFLTFEHDNKIMGLENDVLSIVAM